MPKKQSTLAVLQQRLLELEETVAALRESEAKYHALLDESTDPIFSIFPDGEYAYANLAFAVGTGVPQQDIIGRRIWDVFSREEADKRFAVVQAVIESRQTHTFDVRVPRPDGDRYYITTVKPVIDGEGRVTSVICISKEITERKAMEERLHDLSTHDTLTRLYNRHSFDAEMVRAQAGDAYPVAILIADLDDLKSVNDRAGHAAGDELIRAAAELLRYSFRAGDMIARIGGDEFAVLLKGANETTVVASIERLRARLETMAAPQPRLSIGFAVCEAGGSVADAMRLADRRMYEDKRRRKGVAIPAGD